MPNRTKLQLVRMALHASATSITDEPGSLVHQAWKTLSPRWAQNFTEDGSNQGDGDANPRNPTDEIVGLDIGDDLYGLSENDGTTVDKDGHWDRDIIFSRAFGAAATAGGAATAMTADTGGGVPASGTLGIDDDTKVAPGNGIFFTTSDGNFVGREVVSEAAGTPDVLTLDRAFSALPTNGATIAGALTYVVTPQSDIERIFTDWEVGASGTGYRRKHFGSNVESLTISAAAKGQVTWNAVLQTNHVDRSASPAEPSITLAAKGSNIVAMKSPFMIGDNEFCLTGAEIVIQSELKLLECMGGENGGVGHYEVMRRFLMNNLSFYAGGSSQEIPHNGAGFSVDSISDGDLFDASLQLGRAISKVCYFRCPALQFFDVSIEDNGGVLSVSCSAEATRSPNQANVSGVARMHIG